MSDREALAQLLAQMSRQDQGGDMPMPDSRGIGRFGLLPSQPEPYALAQQALRQDMQMSPYRPTPKGLFDPFAFEAPQQVPAVMPMKDRWL